MSDKETTGTYGRHIVKGPVEYSLCTGCTSCEMVCSLLHEGAVSPSCNRIFLQPGPTKTMIHDVLTCQQCLDHPCYEACPLKGSAMCIDENGIVYIDEERCIGCGLCQKACKFEPSRINMVKSRDKTKRKAKKCDLCRQRPEGPACVEYCPARCLAVSDTEPLPWNDPALAVRTAFVDIYAIKKEEGGE